jgi:hypothetical protein
MLESRGDLVGLTALETMKKFCAVANPNGKIYHLNFFLTLLARREKRRGPTAKSWHRPGDIFQLLNFAYQNALAKHKKENPTGPLPIQVSYKQYGFSGFSLQYETKSETRIRIEIPWDRLRETVPCRMFIFGKIHPEVLKKTTLAGLPEPVYVPQPRPIIAEPKPVQLVSLADVKIPLGDLLDFIEKYRK